MVNGPLKGSRPGVSRSIFREEKMLRIALDYRVVIFPTSFPPCMEETKEGRKEGRSSFRHGESHVEHHHCNFPRKILRPIFLPVPVYLIFARCAVWIGKMAVDLWGFGWFCLDSSRRPSVLANRRLRCFFASESFCGAHLRLAADRKGAMMIFIAPR